MSKKKKFDDNMDIKVVLCYNILYVNAKNLLSKKVHLFAKICYKTADRLYISALYLNVDSGISQALAAAVPVIFPVLHF